MYIVFYVKLCLTGIHLAIYDLESNLLEFTIKNQEISRLFSTGIFSSSFSRLQKNYWNIGPTIYQINFSSWNAPLLLHSIQKIKRSIIQTEYYIESHSPNLPQKTLHFLVLHNGSTSNVKLSFIPSIVTMKLRMT